MTGHGKRLERIANNQDWLAVSGGLSALCNGWSARRDLYVYLGRDGGQGVAAAFYDPASGSIEINSEKAFGPNSNGARIGDITKRIELSKYPVAGGLALHESGHARFSTADWVKLKPVFSEQKSAWRVFELLEETRIEGRMARLFKYDRGYLRASAKTLVMGGDSDKWSARAIMQLVIGREVVGVLEHSDVEPVYPWLYKQDGWNSGIVARASEIILEFMSLQDSGVDLDAMVLLAKELDKLMPPDPGGDGEDDEDSSDEGAGGGIPGAVAAALDKAAREGAAEAIAEGHMAEAREKREAQEKQNDEHARNVEMAEDTFDDSAGGVTNTPSALRNRRAPTAEERGAAVKLSKDLERARYRDRTVVEFGSQVPPGRFNGGEAMRMDAARKMGSRTDPYSPFRTKKRLEHDDPPLTVGIMADVSGSMTASQPNVATATWVLSDATYRVGNASSAMVYFGQSVYPGLRKGERLAHVRVWDGRDPWEQFDGGFRALDGELNLLNGSGARLLVVVSDGQYGGTIPVPQGDARDKWLRYCVRNGVGVVWLTPRDGSEPTEVHLPGVEIVEIGKDVLSVTSAIGSACIRALERVSGV